MSMTESHWLQEAVALGERAFLCVDQRGRILQAAGNIEPLFERPASQLSQLSELLSPAGLSQVLDAVARASAEHGPQRLIADSAGGRILAWTIGAFGEYVVARIKDLGPGTPETSTFVDLIDCLPLAVAHVDAELRYRFVNRSYERYFRKSREDIQGKTPIEIVGQATFDKMRPIWERALAGEPVRLDSRLPMADGRERHLRVNYVPDKSDGQIHGFFALIDDVTEYSAALEVLRAVHQVVNQPESTGRETVQELLEIGLRYLQLDIGLVSHIVADNYVIEWIAGQADGLQSGHCFQLGETYCAVTLAAEDVVATRRAGEDDRFRGHPCYQSFGLEAYIGLPLRLHGKLWGTLNFSSAQSREQRFSELDKELVRLIGDAVEHVLAEDARLQRLSAERDKMRALAFTDGLTGARSRAYMDNLLNELVDQQIALDEPVALAILDLDHFKRINDNYGHDAGDAVLRGVSKLVLDNIDRQRDTFGRMGGEEFALVLRETDLDTAQQRLERLRGLIAGAVVDNEGERLQVTASFGVTALRPGEVIRNALRRADQALYEAKRHGRNRVVCSRDDAAASGGPEAPET